MLLQWRVSCTAFCEDNKYENNVNIINFIKMEISSSVLSPVSTDHCSVTPHTEVTLSLYLNSDIFTLSTEERFHFMWQDVWSNRCLDGLEVACLICQSCRRLQWNTQDVQSSPGKGTQITSPSMNLPSIYSTWAPKWVPLCHYKAQMIVSLYIVLFIIQLFIERTRSLTDK